MAALCSAALVQASHVCFSLLDGWAAAAVLGAHFPGTLLPPRPLSSCRRQPSLERASASNQPCAQGARSTHAQATPADAPTSAPTPTWHADALSMSTAPAIRL